MRLPGIPEGTEGRVVLVNGWDLWIRYHVMFDNGVNLGSITALVFDPSLYVGFTNRRRFGNREGLDLPFWFYFQATDVVVPFVGSAVSGPLMSSSRMRSSRCRPRLAPATAFRTSCGRSRSWAPGMRCSRPCRCCPTTASRWS